MYAPEEAARQILTDEIIMNGAIITFLPLHGGRGREGTEGRLPVTSSQYTVYTIGDRILLICD